MNAIEEATKESTGIPSLKVEGTEIEMRVGSGQAFYCTPRPGWDADLDYNGPYTELEVALCGPIPIDLWSDWKNYSEDGENAMTSELRVFAYVPVSKVQDLAKRLAVRYE